MLSNIVYTPEQVAEMLQISKNTVYQLINRGEIVAKRIGRVYRVPKQSLAFVFTGLDEDILRSQEEDEKNLVGMSKAIRSARKQIWARSKSF